MRRPRGGAQEVAAASRGAANRLADPAPMVGRTGSQRCEEDDKAGARHRPSQYSTRAGRRQSRHCSEGTMRVAYVMAGPEPAAVPPEPVAARKQVPGTCLPCSSPEPRAHSAPGCRFSSSASFGLLFVREGWFVQGWFVRIRRPHSAAAASLSPFSSSLRFPWQNTDSAQSANLTVHFCPLPTFRFRRSRPARRDGSGLEISTAMVSSTSL